MSRTLTDSDIAQGVEKLTQVIRESNPEGNYALVGVRSMTRIHI